MAKAKSEKSLSSFLPSDVKSGFADKVMANGAGPEGPPMASDGKENVYMGFRNEQGQRDGFGVMQVENGPTYTGQWSGSKRDGHGTLFFEKGVFEGQWVQGNAHGKGMVHFKNGDTFQGGYEQNRKCGFGTYTWADGTTEAGEYLDGQKHGQHHWQRGTERWEMFYDKGALVGTKRRPGGNAGGGNSTSSSETKKEFVAQKLVLDKARPAPRPTPPPSPSSEPRQVASSQSSRCRSNSAFRAQGFTDEEIALMERKSPPGSPSPLPDRAAQPGGHSGRVFFPTSARTRPLHAAAASAAPAAPAAPELLRMGKGSAPRPAQNTAAPAPAQPAPGQAAPAADAAAGAAVELAVPPPAEAPRAAEPLEELVESEAELDTDEPSTPGVHDA